MKKSIVFINQSSGYLMIDIINAHVPYYTEMILLTGALIPRETPLDHKVKVINLKTYDRTSSLKRIFSWTLFWFQSLYYIFLKFKTSKIYFVSNPPINIFSARFLKRDFAFLVYDIFPYALAKLNIIQRESPIYKFWEKTNNLVYNKAQLVFTLSDGMKKSMSNDAKDKIRVVPVWTNNSFFKPVSRNDNKFVKQQNLQNKFIITYSGNMGKTHPVEKLITLAELLVHEKDIFIFIIGEGDKKAKLLQKQNKLDLPNLRILDFQPTELFPHVLAAADVGVVTLENNATDLSVPSKTYNIMSVGKPILAIANAKSELAQIIYKYEIGKSFDETEIIEMSKFILSLKNDKDLYYKMHQNSLLASLDFTSENAKRMILKP